MLLTMLAACKKDGEDDEGTLPPPTENNPGGGGAGSGSGGSGGGGGSATPETEKYPWLKRIYRFSEEKFTAAPDEKDSIVNYLKSIGAIAVDEADETNIARVLDMLAYTERRQIQFTGENTLSVATDDYTYEADYLYKIDVYKNVTLYEVSDTAMQTKLSYPTFTLSLDGKA
jgi:hypothetical protein